MTRLFHLTLILMLIPATSVAQGPNEAGVFLDPGGTQNIGIATAFSQFDIYVVGFGMDDFDQLEGGVANSVQWVPEAGSGFTVLGSNFPSPEPLCINPPCFGPLSNFYYFSAACHAAGPTAVLVTIRVGWFDAVVPTDVEVCLTPGSPSTFIPAAPGYRRCDGTWQDLALTPAVGYPDTEGCLILNATVETSQSSLGSVKAGF